MGNISDRPKSGLTDCRDSGQRNPKIAENHALSVEDFLLENTVGLVDFSREEGEHASELADGTSQVQSFLFRLCFSRTFVPLPA